MKSLSLIQIGDVHFPDKKSSHQNDRKDEAFPEPIVATMEVDPFRVCLRWLAKECESGCDGLVLCGDITSAADMSSYRVVAERLVKLFSLTDKSRWSDDQIHVVPGNHDIERKYTKKDEDIFQKFSELKGIWSELGVDVLASDDLRVTTVAKASLAIKVYSLNSCIGCGEKRFFPQKVREELSNIFEKYAKMETPKDAFDPVGEELDTPAFHRTHVEDMSFDIGGQSDKSVSVVVSHHNILPQSTPRIALYAEVVNSGFVRSELVRTPSPIIYCHGHIHSDPIEVVQDPSGGNSMLICVSAPELIDGYNKVLVFFNKRDIPVGCRVVRCKVAGNSIDRDDVIDIPFYCPSDCDEVCDDGLLKFVKALDRKYFRFDELKEKYFQVFEKNAQKKILKSMIEEAEWYGLVRVLDRDKDFEYWQVSGVL